MIVVIIVAMMEAPRMMINSSVLLYVLNKGKLIYVLHFLLFEQVELYELQNLSVLMYICRFFRCLFSFPFTFPLNLNLVHFSFYWIWFLFGMNGCHYKLSLMSLIDCFG